MSSEKEQQAGEIFSNPEESAYEQATSPLGEALDQPQDVTAEAAPAEVPQDAALTGEQPPVPPGQYQPAPVSFVESSRKKLIIIIAAFIVIVVIIVFLISFIRGLGNRSEGDQPVALTYWGLWEDEIIMRPLIDEYIKVHPNVTINYSKQDPIQYRERLTAAIDRGEGPDMFRFHNSWLPMLVNQLAAIPKTVIADDEYTKTFYPVVASDLKIGNNYYGIPLEIDGLMLYYNENILKDASVEVPKTWIDVQDAIPKITVKQNNRILTSAIALGTAENIEHFSDILTLMMLQNGTELSKSFFTCADASSTSCGTEALSFYRQFAEEPNNTWDGTLENSLIAFAGEKVAMVFAPSYQAFSFKAMNPSLQFKTAAVPQLPCSQDPCPSVNWATYWVEGVSSKSKQSAAAWEFLKFLVSSQSLQKLYAEEVNQRILFGEPYSRVDLGSTLQTNEFLAPLIVQAPTMKSFYTASNTFDGETGLNASLVTYLKDAVNSMDSGVSAETALKTAESGFMQVYKRYGLVK